MGQIMFSRHPTGAISLGVFLLGISAFLSSTLDPLFGPLAIACIGAGALLAGILRLRRATVPHIDPRLAKEGGPPRSIEPT